MYEGPNLTAYARITGFPKEHRVSAHVERERWAYCCCRAVADWGRRDRRGRSSEQGAMGTITSDHMSDYLGEPLGIPQLPNVHGSSKRSELRQSLVSPLRALSIEASLCYSFFSD